MASGTPELQQIFELALEQPTPQALEQYLDRACGSDHELRARVLALLQAHREADRFLAATPAVSTSTVDSVPPGSLGTTIGPYRILQHIGQGGFGDVFVAEQSTPVRRRVALKVIKPGMASKEVVARFEAERQALAMMQHPNIASVFGAGSTEQGRPYFVMELVKGVPLTEYCDSNCLSTEKRLQLFVDACHAIQHAHQKGIIHRDIKPSNILVSEQDGKPIVKVIDFGVAKALHQQLTERTLFTAFGQMIGTPQYMSPEQAEMSGLDIDTRSDVYSLGVLLYELLTGTTPLDAKKLRSAGYAEMQRMIREQEPQRPSDRVSTLGEKATAVGEHRRIDPGKLRHQLAGELDWIVMKSLDKERGRRYESANAFAEDIERYLTNEPVLACPPSTTYRLRKFARRYRAGLAAGGALAALLIGVIALNMVLAFKAMRAERLVTEREENERAEAKAAQLARANEFALGQQAAQERDDAVAAEKETAEQREVAVKAEQQAEANVAQARQAVEQYLQTVLGSSLLLDPRQSDLRRRLLMSASDFYRSIVESSSVSELAPATLAKSQLRWGQLLKEMGEQAAAAEQLRAARAHAERQTPAALTSEELGVLVEACLGSEDYGAAVQHAERLVQITPNAWPARRWLFAAMHGLATHDAAGGSVEAALQHEARAREVLQTPIPDSVERTAVPVSPDAVDVPEANPPSAVSPSSAELGGEDWGRIAESFLTSAKLETSRLGNAAALNYARDAIRAAERARNLEPQISRHGRWLAFAHQQAARALRQQSEFDQAVEAYRQASKVWNSLCFGFPTDPEFDARLIESFDELAEFQREQGRPEEAELTARRGEQHLQQLPRSLSEDLFQLAATHALLAETKSSSALSTDRAPSPKADPASVHAQRAIECLQQAAQAGFQIATPLSEVPWFASLRKRGDFRELIPQLQSQPSSSNPIASASSPSAPEANFDLQLLLIASQRGLAEAQRAVGLWDEAGQTLTECAAQLDRLQERFAERKALIDSERGLLKYVRGHIDWARKEYVVARRVWDAAYQQVYAAKLVAPEKDRLLIAQALAQPELALLDLYGRIGAWPEAARHRARYLTGERIQNAPTECRYSILTLLGDAGETYEQSARYLYEQFAADDPTHLTWALTNAPQSVVSPESLVELAQAGVDSNRYGGWHIVMLGNAEANAGRYRQALEHISLNLYQFFLRALIAARIGDEGTARYWFEIGDYHYSRELEEWLASPNLLSTDLIASHSDNWWEVPQMQLRRCAAARALDPQGGADPWADLLEARGYAVCGEDAKAERLFERAIAARPTDPRLWIARARLRSVLGQHDAAETDFARAIELAPDDPNGWIARGKYRLEQGCDAEADSDLQHAAELSADDLDLFIRTGVWITGAYPSDMASHWPPEDQLHPARPIPLSEEYDQRPEFRTWQRRPVGHHRIVEHNQIQLESVTKAQPNTSAYVLAVVYAPREQTVNATVGTQKPMRMWVNGTLVSNKPQDNQERGWEGFPRTPITLRAGRNTILLRVATSDRTCSVTLRLDDSPIDRAMHAARIHDWQEAIRQFEKWPLIALNITGHHWSAYCKALAAIEDRDRYERAAEMLAAEARYFRPGSFYEAIRGGTMMPNRIFNRTLCLSMLIDAEKTRKNSWEGVAAVRGLYRAEEYQRAIDLAKALEIENNAEEVQPILALAYYRLGQPTAAEEWLKKAEDNARTWWRERAESQALTNLGIHNGSQRLTLLREAKREIQGIELESQEELDSFRTSVQRLMSGVSPELAAYDRALLYEPGTARLLMARARRLAELQRWEDFEATLAKSLEPGADIAWLWLQAGDLQMERGNQKAAVDAFARVRELDASKNEWSHELRRRFAKDDRIADALLAARPDDQGLLDLRVLQLLNDERWKDAAPLFKQRVDKQDVGLPQLYQLALLEIASGDRAAHGRTCRRLIELSPSLDDDGKNSAYLIPWVCALDPGSNVEPSTVLAIAQQAVADLPADASSWAALGLVHLRADRTEEAIQAFEQAIALTIESETIGKTSPAYVWYLLAIAYHQQADDARAESMYQKAEQWMEHARAERQRGWSNLWPWNRRVTLELLGAEARQTLGKRAAQTTEAT